MTKAKLAARARDRARYLADPEKKRAATRAYIAADRPAHNARVIRYQKQHPEKVRQWNATKRLNKYGLTAEAFNALLTSQSGCCACCGKPMESPCIDHDHHTGRVRGLLCSPCNFGIGLLGDNVDGLRRALAYLEHL